MHVNFDFRKSIYPFTLLLSGFILLCIFYWRVDHYRYVGVSDFDQIYMSGLAWRHHISPYQNPVVSAVANGPQSIRVIEYYYSPLNTMLFSPLSLLPFPEAAFLWRVVTCTLLLVGFWKFSKLSIPDWSVPTRIFIIGLLSVSSSVRWNLVQMQPTVLIVALLLNFAAYSNAKRWPVCDLLFLVICGKITFLLPAVGLYFLHGKEKRLLYLLVLALFLNGIALINTGTQRTFNAYRNAIAQMEQPFTSNDPSVRNMLADNFAESPHSALVLAASPGWRGNRWAGEKLNLVFILSAWTVNLKQAHLMSGILVVLFLFNSGLQIYRARSSGLSPPNLFHALVFSNLMTLSLLVVYHARYDVIALVPMAFVAIGFRKYLPGNRCSMPVFILVVLLSGIMNSRGLYEWHRWAATHGALIKLVPVCGYIILIIYILSSSMLSQMLEIKRESASLVP